MRTRRLARPRQDVWPAAGLASSTVAISTPSRKTQKKKKGALGDLSVAAEAPAVPHTARQQGRVATVQSRVEVRWLLAEESRVAALRIAELQQVRTVMHAIDRS